MKEDVLTDMLEILTAGGRLNPEPSRALPEEAYRNPADSFEFPSERLRKEEARRVARAKQRGGK